MSTETTTTITFTLKKLHFLTDLYRFSYVDKTQFISVAGIISLCASKSARGNF